MWDAIAVVFVVTCVVAMAAAAFALLVIARGPYSWMS